MKATLAAKFELDVVVFIIPIISVTAFKLERPKTSFGNTTDVTQVRHIMLN